MRLAEVDRGDSLRSRVLIQIISTVLGARLPDAARVAFYHKGYVGTALGEWTQAVMRGPSAWTVGERELMAAMVAHWNSSTFCIGAHRAIAVRGVEPAVVDACLTDYHTAPISPPLRATLSFLETMTLRPDDLDLHAQDAMDTGVSRAQLRTPRRRRFVQHRHPIRGRAGLRHPGRRRLRQGRRNAAQTRIPIDRAEAAEWAQSATTSTKVTWSGDRLTSRYRLRSPSGR